MANPALPPGHDGNPSKPALPPPYAAYSLHTPLSVTQKAAVLLYMSQFWDISAGGTKFSGGLTDPSFPTFSKYTDGSIIVEYDSIVSGQPAKGDPGEAIPIQPNIPGINNAIIGADNALNAVPNFLKKLGDSHLWTRVAEFTIGALLIAIGANAALKAVTTQSKNPVTQGAKGVINPVGTAAKTAGRATFLAARKREANKYVR